jgi:glyoxylase-like metal-dependent hydrolase (beta-lactamase superfamily II)
MNRPMRLLIVAACCLALAAPFALVDEAPAHAAATTDGERPELAYLKQVNRWRPPSDPQLVLLLMAQFANAGRYVEGIDYFNDALKRFDSQLDDERRALYLTALASLRAQHANSVFLLRRPGWVRATLQLLDEAKRLTRGDAFVTRWMSGVVRAQLPGFLGERDNALQDLAWCEVHAARAPHLGWLREVYFHLAALHRARGDAAAAQRYQALSGLEHVSKPVIFTTPFSLDAGAGHMFSSRTIREVVPGTVYVLSGFEFTEYYFIVSADRRQLIAIDAGTRADAARAALEALRARVPSLPPLTTVLITHAHWDHVGGHRYFRSLDPAPRFIGRSNYQDELARDSMANPATLQRFFGQEFRLEDVLSYRPDVTIDRPTPLEVGGTRFELLPTRGGETDDALLVHMPEQGVTFVGDILMPYVGAPFAEEGSLDGMLAAIEQLHTLKPQVLLHGHEPLTQLFSSTAMLSDLRVHLAWLRDEVLRAMRSGQERGAIHAANLMPPTLESSAANVHLAYLVLRENVIDRLIDQNSGYWQSGLQGLDTLTDAERGTALVDYLGVSEARLAAAAERMLADGKHELAATVLRWTQPHFPDSARLAAARRLAYLKLVEKYQNINPFKFILYAGQVDHVAAQINPQPTALARESEGVAATPR